MKKLIIVALLVVMFCAGAFAEDIDLTQYSIEELNSLSNRIAQEISSRGANEPGWFDYGVGAILPKPVSTSGQDLKTGEFVVNNDDSFYATIEGASQDDFTKYISDVAARGFTIDVNRDTISYEAFNSEGYKIHMIYFGTAGLSVDVDAPKVNGNLAWPRSEIASLLPVPDSDKGSVSWEADYGFVAYVQYTKEQFDAYANECADRGFTVDYNKGDTWFYADNADGYHVSLKYEGNNTMFVRIDEPDDND